MRDMTIFTPELGEGSEPLLVSAATSGASPMEGSGMVSDTLGT